MMEKLLTNTYVQALWAMFIQNNTVLGIDVLGNYSSEKVLRDSLLELWQANVAANVPAKDLPAATLDSFYQLVESQLSDALSVAKANL